MTDTSLREWFFRVISTEERVDRLESEGLSVRASSDIRAVQRVLPLDDFSHPIRDSAMKALPAYLAFFCLENAARELISERLTDVHGPDWWDTKAPSAMRGKVEDRRTKEGVNRWHVARGAHYIYYTDFGDLKLLITNNWTDFEDLFPDQNWVASRFTELELSRNVIAHTNTLDDRELSRIKLYLQDWIQQVG